MARMWWVLGGTPRQVVVERLLAWWWAHIECLAQVRWQEPVDDDSLAEALRRVESGTDIPDMSS